ncbi:hypothetical protein DLM75_14560 [Leptospira stimsonii]|uniref:Uncharacterized protein n=1 Tax=Leptospira stimsonii TaxID=2202203 RepID=A0A396Z4K4_9LEPT|nr:hypothetical protein DLM75_14560 [Leptospira stimsonii]
MESPFSEVFWISFRISLISLISFLFSFGFSFSNAIAIVAEIPSFRRNWSEKRGREPFFKSFFCERIAQRSRSIQFLCFRSESWLTFFALFLFLLDLRIVFFILTLVRFSNPMGFPLFELEGFLFSKIFLSNQIPFS